MIATELKEAGFDHSRKQCRDKTKKLKADYKKIRYKCNTTGEGQYPEWDFYDVMDATLGHQPATQPPVVISSMACAVAELATTTTAQLPIGTVSAGNTTTIKSLRKPGDLDGTQSVDVPQQASSRQTAAVTPLQQRKRKKSKGEDIIELMQKVLKAQEESDKRLVELVDCD